jgi:hypothetical protein
VNTQNAQWRIVDDEAVIVNIETSYYYGLNQTGTLVWLLLVEAPHTLDAVAARLAQVYDIPLAQASADARRVIEHLVSEQLVKEA